jgi:hypothetical protein
VFLGEHASLIFIPIINKNYPFILKNVPSSAIVHFIRVISVLILTLAASIFLVTLFLMRQIFHSQNTHTQLRILLHQHLPFLSCALCSWTIAVLILGMIICICHCLLTCCMQMLRWSPQMQLLRDWHLCSARQIWLPH